MTNRVTYVQMLDHWLEALRARLADMGPGDDLGEFFVDEHGNLFNDMGGDENVYVWTGTWEYHDVPADARKED